MPELIGTIDVGTNTAHLLVSHVTDDGEAVPVFSETRYVRLGEGVDANGSIHPEALKRLGAALTAFERRAQESGVTHIYVAGTSASRDTREPQALVDFVKRETGLDYQIISGEEEALLTSLGAISLVDEKLRGRPAVIVDIGGGSTEITVVLTEKGALKVESSLSLDIGSVRLTERFFRRLPPDPTEIGRAEDFVRAALSVVPVSSGRGRTLVGAAGTMRALAMIDGGVTSWIDLPPDGTVISRESCRKWRFHLLGLSYEATLALNEPVLRGRADVIAAGVLILDLVFDQIGSRNCVVSPGGLRHGMAIRYASVLKTGRQ